MGWNFKDSGTKFAKIFFFPDGFFKAVKSDTFRGFGVEVSQHLDSGFGVR